MVRKKKRQPIDRPLTDKQKAFCHYYVEIGVEYEAVLKAGYNPQDRNVACRIARTLLKNEKCQQEIKRNLDQIRDKQREQSIMNAQEVMARLTAIARGEEKDQFGLDISANDRIKALVELAKRTIDIEQRVAGKPDSVVEIKLDWNRDDN